MEIFTRLICSLVILIFSFRCSFSSGVEDFNRIPNSLTNMTTCKEMLESFAFVTSNFTYCAIQHAKPISVCQSCVNNYLRVKNVYSDILRTRDIEGNLCKDQLINLDPLEVVSSGYDYVDQLWSKANCDSCFTFDTEGSQFILPHLKDKIHQLLNYSVYFSSCVSEYHNESIYPDSKTCINCLQNYSSVNDLYEKIKADSGEINFCMDIVEVMNITRSTWSKILGCHINQRQPEKTFIGIMSGIMVSAFLFYVTIFIFTRKEEHPVAPQTRWKEQFSKRPSVSSNID